MVDMVGDRPRPVGERSVGRVERTVPPRGPQTAAPTPARAPAAGVSAIARELAAAPPVDAEHVARIRRAIADGTFPILPATVADRLLAFKLNWTGDDQA